MEQIHIELGLETRTFERPQGFTHATVCSTSGYLPGTGCPTRSELFAPGTVPNRPCHIHVAYQINIVTGMMPSPWCPPEQIRSGVGILRDRSWMDLAGDVSLPDAGQEVPRAVREGIMCTVHNQFNAGRVDYSAFDFDNMDFDDPNLADIINNILQGSGENDIDEDIDDSQYQYPFGYVGDDVAGESATDNQPAMPDHQLLPTPTPMPERTPIPEATATPAPPIITNPDLPPADPGSPPSGPIINSP